MKPLSHINYIKYLRKSMDFNRVYIGGYIGYLFCKNICVFGNVFHLNSCYFIRNKFHIHIQKKLLNHFTFLGYKTVLSDRNY